ncbi:Beta-glucan synthesis-associated [Mycena kentingensis (nom. inval.)]|nr:Beta-glucan synthesis-associated [Mycena kentingensis (nom. inval.)]
MRAITSLASLIALACSVNALVGVDWSMRNVPENGLKDITFPIAVRVAEHIDGYYFAQQFAFVGVADDDGNDIGYTGIQPTVDAADGRPMLHGVFSSFIANTTTNDANCFLGADGGPGVSCAVDWPGVYGRTYHFEVAHEASTNTWIGTVLDIQTGERVHIGSYQLPPGVMGVKSSQGGFVEWYPWNLNAPDVAANCSELPFQRTVFSAPYTSQPGAVGSITEPYLYGECGSVEEATFSTEFVPELGGWEVECGLSAGGPWLGGR